MKILAIDTVAGRCAAAIFDSEAGRCLHEVSRDIGRGHAEQLMDVIGEALAGAGCTYEDIARIAVAVGPGSFTGVRVGVATARGLALALGIPAVGVSTLAGLAAEARAMYPGMPVLIGIDARRGEVYAQAYDSAGLATTEPRVATLAALVSQAAGHVLAGSAAPLLRDAAGLPADTPIGPVEATAEIATYARLGALAVPDGPPHPLYLRAPDAKPQEAPIARQP